MTMLLDRQDGVVHIREMLMMLLNLPRHEGRCEVCGAEADRLTGMCDDCHDSIGW